MGILYTKALLSLNDLKEGDQIVECKIVKTGMVTARDLNTVVNINKKEGYFEVIDFVGFEERIQKPFGMKWSRVVGTK